ncbi:MAG: DUF6776 family protein [Thiotrichaceae bacterium]
MKLDIDKNIGMSLPAPSDKSRCLITLLSALLIVGLVGLGLYKKNYWVFKHEVKEEKIKVGSVELAELQEKFNTLKKELIALSRENSIQQSTNKALNRKMLEVENELTATRKNQLLYDDILSADDLNKGLHVRHFDMRVKEGLDEGRRYHYTVILSQVRGEKKILKGQYVIRVTGQEAGKTKSYSHRELAADGVEAERKFSLKYYQSLEGDIVLPEAFIPEKVTLWIIPKNKKYSTKRKAYQWEPLIGQQN